MRVKAPGRARMLSILFLDENKLLSEKNLHFNAFHQHIFLRLPSFASPKGCRKGTSGKKEGQMCP